MSRITTYLEQHWRAEAARHFNWLPVLFGVGIGIYFALPVEPPLWLLPVLAGLAAMVMLRARQVPFPARVALLLITFGAAAASVATQRTHPVILHEALSPRPIAGVVDDVQHTEHGVRLTLTDVHIPDAPENAVLPNRVRLSVRLKKDSTLALPAIGDTIAITAALLPPMGPALPHGYDFARHFYFADIGAIGYGLPPWKIASPASDNGLYGDFRNWRLRLTEHIISKLGVGTGGIAAGLITGDARAITEDDFDALRASNLYHIIAISGEHMVVISGVIFVALRLLALVLLPARWRFRPEVKSVAAAVALLLVTAYLFVTGVPISATRAYGMIALVLLAIMLRRRVDAVRSLALTAFVMLLWDPSNLLDPGFQLSFAATLAILALVEAVLRGGVLDKPLVPRVLTAIGTMLLISVVAEGATAFFVIAQFNNLSLYGVFANMLATSLVSLFMMPMVALFFVLLPFGLHDFALALLRYGIDALLALAYWVAGFPHAQQFVPSPPGWGVALFALGLLWLCLWQTRWRRFGVVPMVLGVMTLLIPTPPDLLVGVAAKQIMLRTPDGFALARGRASGMVPQLWAYGVGQASVPKAAAPDWRCDARGCVARVRGKLVAFPADAAALADDCARAQVIVSTLTPLKCTSRDVQFVSAAALARGVSALWVNGDKVRIAYSSDWQGRRPWSHGEDSEAEAGDDD
ncbi:MAG: ComEC/Rec2 family competence protein [Rickettsiales bacterium]